MVVIKDMLQLFIYLLFAAESLTQPASTGNEYKTEEATCIDLPACATLIKALDTIPLPLPKSLEVHLRSMHCGFTGNIPKVYCPKPGDIVGWKYIYHSNAYLLTRNSCGFSMEPRIIGGNESELGEFPWMALLVYGVETFCDLTDSKTKPYQCGGSVITERYILTAAHCITSELRRVRLGEHRISTLIDCQNYMHLKTCNPPFQEFGIEEHIKQILYRPPSHRSDIALIRLDGSIDFSAGNIRPVCLPLYDNLRSLNLNSKNLTVIGWGYTGRDNLSDVLLKVRVEVVDKEKCKKLYRSYFGDNEICAGTKGQDSCRGDSGGPLMLPGNYDNQSRYVQHGIVSHGSVLCGVGLPGVYTRVSKYMKWILNSLRP